MLIYIQMTFFCALTFAIKICYCLPARFCLHKCHSFDAGAQGVKSTTEPWMLQSCKGDIHVSFSPFPFPSVLAAPQTSQLFHPTPAPHNPSRFSARLSSPRPLMHLQWCAELSGGGFGLRAPCNGLLKVNVLLSSGISHCITMLFAFRLGWLSFTRLPLNSNG